MLEELALDAHMLRIRRGTALDNISQVTVIWMNFGLIKLQSYLLDLLLGEPDWSELIN